MKNQKTPALPAPAAAPTSTAPVTPTLDTLVVVHLACAADAIGGPRVWVLRGWSEHMKAARAAEHAANSFAKHRREFGVVAEIARAFTVARCVDFGLAPDAAATLVRERVAARAEKES